MFTTEWWLDKLFLAPGILFGLVIHEFCHGYAAWRLGDPTAKLAGRLSFNPLKHLDLLGTVALFVARIGWAKPVPVDPRNFRDPRKGILITSIAGPASNLALGAVLGLCFRVLITFTFSSLAVYEASWLGLVYRVLYDAIFINFVLAIFNILPIPPLDGSNVLWAILPRDAAASYGHFIARYGRTVLIVFFLAIFLGPSLGFPIFQLFLFGPVLFLVRLFAGV
jgi:Zn-dependent protease